MPEHAICDRIFVKGLEIASLCMCQGEKGTLKNLLADISMFVDPFGYFSGDHISHTVDYEKIALFVQSYCKEHANCLQKQWLDGLIQCLFLQHPTIKAIDVSVKSHCHTAYPTGNSYKTGLIYRDKNEL